MRTPSLEQIQYMEDHIRDTKVPGIIAACSVCLTSACLAVCLRFVSRRIGKVKLEANDWLIVLALILYSAYTVACALATRYGMGKHLIMVTNPKGLAISIIVAECTLPCTLLVVKLSLLSLYCRLFPLPWMRKLSILVALVIAAYTAAQVFVDILQCLPIKALWDPIISGRCIDLYPMFMTMVIMNLITDVIVLILPILPVWRIQMSRSQKWQLSILFSLGGFVCIVTFIRLFYINQFGSVDLTWEGVEFGQLSLTEGCIAIIASSLPACRPLLKYLRKKPTTKGKTISQNFIPISDRKKQTDYHTSAVNASRGNSANTDSGIDDEQRSYIPLG